MDRVLLAEDDIGLLEQYERSIRAKGLEVCEVWNGEMILGLLRMKGRDHFDVILSDSDMPELCGYSAVDRALQQGLLNRDRTLIIGMSDDSDNQYFWRGIAHVGGFYDKDYHMPHKFGEIVCQALRNFRSGGLWRERMPVISNS